MTLHIELYQHGYAAWHNFWGPPGMVVWMKGIMLIRLPHTNSKT